MTPSKALEDRRIVWALGGTIVLLGAIPAFASRLSPDTSWLLYAADHMLRGARLYVDLIEVNPPLILWLDAVPVAIARLLSLPSGLVFNAMVLALAVGSTVWCDRLLRRVLPADRLLRHCLTLLILFALAPLAREDFGEREHMFLALALPYVLLTTIRAGGGQAGRSQALAVGMAAGLGIALKPYFIVLWLALEAVMLARLGWRKAGVRAESLAVAAVGIGYVLAVVLWAPAYFQVVRTMAGPYYTFLRNSLLTTALLGDGAQLPMIVLLAWLALRRDVRRQLLCSVLAAAMTALWLAAVLQHKGWRYHFYPALALSVVLAGVLALDLEQARGRIRRVFAAVARAGVLGIALVTTGACIRQILDPRNPRYDADPDVSRLIPIVSSYAGSHVLMLSWSAASAFPLMTYAQVENASRFNHLWILGASYWPDLWRATPLRYHSREEMSSLERGFMDSVVDDMQRTEPALIVVLRPGPDRPPLGLRRLDFIGYFMRDPRFAGLFTRYTFERQVGEYWIFRRVPPGALTAPPPPRPARLPFASPGLAR
jgi:hypothetical protein